ncbi:60S ribosomal protein-like protein L35 [Lipomyces kononenkoae]|uniref:60S ribosomal protein-like protein L35 n=1 Tax=Lipomyces kononenkoae TaxID=34357 RepID=A0ACC3T9Z2_LIPKO
MPGVKAYTLREKSKADLEAQLVELKQELASLRAQKARGASATNLVRMHTVRKSIARVLTIINQQQRAQLRLFYKGKKYIPLDLRVKKTRAQRRQLTKHQKSLKTEKEKKKSIAFPQRKYALKA